MNSQPLPPEHGAPVRVIVPGVAGARSVKWLDRITVQPSESKNHYQQRDYKILPEEASDSEAAQKYWDVTPAIQDMPINSVIGSPLNGDAVELDPDGTVLVQGYALPEGHHGPVIRVEVSADDGRSWTDAELSAETSKWAWALWKARVKLEKGEGRRLLSRATDKGGNIQKAHSAWNLRGCNYDGYGESRDLEVL